MARFKLCNGERVALTAEEEAAHDAFEAEASMREAEIIDARATAEADAAIGKALVRLLWDIEGRLRALGSDSGLAEVRAITSRAEYRAGLVDYIKGQL